MCRKAVQRLGNREGKPGDLPQSSLGSVVWRRTCGGLSFMGSKRAARGLLRIEIKDVKTILLCR